ncbi:PEP-CTERM sorting domain-containing protein [Niveibacterium sp. SC-1]|uniref:PEP-CTERM sorting domain-containing protein n=1 Tax=Niveibacterium sp. SC-1 TaxID=3135646 RepID=UPI00312045BD
MRSIRSIFAIVAGSASSLALAAPITVDGQLGDWIGAPHARTADWTPLRSTTVSALEDQSGALGTYLSPGYGGQAYDAEAMYAEQNGGVLNIAIVTGLRPNNPQNAAGNSFAPGDILFDFNRDGTPDFGLVLTSTVGLTVGGLYAGSSWNVGLWSSPGVLADASHPSPYEVAVRQGGLLGMASFAYAGTPVSGLGAYGSDAHYVIEAAIPVALFGSEWSRAMAGGIDISWAAYCANDIIQLTLDPHSVPEPGSLALAGLGLAGLIKLRRRKR